MFKNLLSKLTGKPQQTARKRVSTTLSELYQALQAGIIPAGEQTQVITRLGELAWVEPTGNGGFNVLVWGESLINNLAPFETVEVIYG